jgi:hypothetical protein
MKKLIIIMMIFFLSACSTHKPSIKLSNIDANILRIIGDVDPETEKDIMHAIERGVTKILITSGGGEVKANIRVAMAIREKGIRLEVVDYCMSSCFNYLFLAAKERNIQPNSVLGFHGTAETSVPGLVKKIGLFGTTIEDEQQLIKDLNFDENIYKKLLERAEKIIEISRLDADLFMVGQKFFDENSISLNHSWFPESQNELNKTTTMLGDKYGKDLVMVGDFGK